MGGLRVLLKSLDFKNAEKLINQGYIINFTNEINEKKLLTVAQQMKCDYFLNKNKLEKVE